jgi:thiol-disulfide isomerase/thioredoxin
MKTLLLKLFCVAVFNLLVVSTSVNANDDFALGVISEAKLLSDFSGFNDNFQKLSPSKQQQKVIAQWPETLHIEIYFGTWCPDSEREVPKLLKLLKENSNISVTLIALDYQKHDPQQLATTHNVKYTPTMIIYRDKSKKEELGRIIERPKQSLVDDIQQFLSQKI